MSLMVKQARREHVCSVCEQPGNEEVSVYMVMADTARAPQYICEDCAWSLFRAVAKLKSDSA